MSCILQPYLNTTIALLTTRVNHTNIYNYMNLEIFIRYIRASVEMPLMIDSNKAIFMRWCIDAACGVHLDMKSHSEGTMFLGGGSMQIRPSKHNLNTWSSTEAKIVGVNYYMSGIFWSIRFLYFQIYKVEYNIIHQYNQSSIIMKKR